MTKITYDEGKLTMRFDGHAGAGEKGSDLVCAGVSTLTGTLRAMCEMCEEELVPTIFFGDALCEVTLEPEEEYRANAIIVLRTVCAGCCVLAQTYPENVQVELKNEETLSDSSPIRGTKEEARGSQREGKEI